MNALTFFGYVMLLCAVAAGATLDTDSFRQITQINITDGILARYFHRLPASTKEKHPIDWYDCTEKGDGNYVHPTDCTRFISCSGNIASERDCADCTVDPVKCPQGRLVYNSTVESCLYADQTNCEGGGENPGTETPKPTQSPTTTDPPGSPNPTNKPPGPPQEGDKCDPRRCVNTGYCQDYLRCDGKTEKLVKENCGKDLVWNPLNPNGTLQIHGGNCDLWENLRPEVEQQYRKDPECLACFWKATGECAAEYDYQPPNGTNRNVLRLRCPAGLVFSEEKQTCKRCKDVKRANGEHCC